MKTKHYVPLLTKEQRNHDMIQVLMLVVISVYIKVVVQSKLDQKYVKGT